MVFFDARGTAKILFESCDIRISNLVCFIHPSPEKGAYGVTIHVCRVTPHLYIDICGPVSSLHRPLGSKVPSRFLRTARCHDLVKTQVADVQSMVSLHKQAVVIAYESIRGIKTSITFKRGRHSESPTRTLRSCGTPTEADVSRYHSRALAVSAFCMPTSFHPMQSIVSPGVRLRKTF